MSTAWLGTRLARDPGMLDRMRAAGRLLGVRRGGDYAFPAWQFGADGNPIPGLDRVISTARGAGIGDERLGQLLELRVGLSSDRRLLDSLREGNVEHVLGVVRQAGTA